MNGLYYTLPLNFSTITAQKEVTKTNLEQSIAQYINLVLVTSLGECKFDENFGCNIWEIDFDLLTEHFDFKIEIEEALINAINRYEKRLKLNEVVVDLVEEQINSVHHSIRLKKKVSIKIFGDIKKTSRSFSFHSYFYLGPLSYV